MGNRSIKSRDEGLPMGIVLLTITLDVTGSGSFSRYKGYPRDELYG